MTLSRAACCLVLLFAAGTAQATSPPPGALPAPVLAPDGPRWVGTLTPNSPAARLAGRGWAAVDPQSGALVLWEQDLALAGRGGDLSLWRRYDGTSWSFSVDAMTPDAPPPEGVVLELSSALDPLDPFPVVLGFTAEDGRQLRTQRGPDGGLAIATASTGAQAWYERRDGQLIGVSTTDRPRTRYLYGEDGLLTGVLWADGSTLLVQRDALGRVTRLAGPGPLSLDLRWSEAQLSVQDTTGATWSLEREGGRVRVRDATGAQVESRYRDGRLVGWTDPKGGQVELTRDPQGRVTGVRTARGAVWTLRWAERGLAAIAGPLGEAWAFSQDTLGRLLRVTDGRGGGLALRRDPQGLVQELDRGGRRTTLRRDAQGRVSEWLGPGGARVRLRRDSRGRITAIDDTLGNTIELLDHVGERPTRLRTRLGAEWSITLDTLGRWTRLWGPEGRVLRAERDTLGRLTRLGAAQGPGSTFTYRGDGALSQLTDAQGTRWGLVRGADGRLRAVRAPDGSTLTLDRDAQGELRAVREGERGFTLDRDAEGRPTRAGHLRFTWSPSGQLVGAAGGGIALALQWAGGALSQLLPLPGPGLGLLYDPSGRVRALVQGARRVELLRGAAGGVDAVQEAGRPPLRMDRDSAGRVVRIERGAHTWRALRDAEGQTARWTGPGGLTLSADRDGGGRPTLLHLPDGALVHRERSLGRAGELVVDAGGAPVADRELILDAVGRVLRVRVDHTEARVHRDALGRLTALESAEGAWTQSPFGHTGPDGSAAAWLEEAQVESLTPAPGERVWGLLAGPALAERGEEGQLRAWLGPDGRLEVRTDPLGRLTALESGRSRFAVSWDPFGRPERVQGPQGETELVWGPEGLLGVASGGAFTPLVHEPGWAYALPNGVCWVADERGWPTVELRSGALSGRLDRSPQGRPRVPAPPLGPGGLWELLPGGPWLDGAGGWDPLGGTALTPASRSPWDPWPQPTPSPALEGAASPPWDPTRWLPEGPWSDPLGLLVALGELPPGLEGAWWAPQPPEAPLGWLPALLAPLGAPTLPAGEVLPLDPGDALTALALRAALPGGPALDEATVVAALLEADLAALPEARWLPSLLPAAARPAPVW